MVSTRVRARSRAVQLGADLRELRKNAGLTVQYVAKSMRVHHSTVSRWERGEAMPSEADTATMLSVLGITAGEDWDRLVDLARHDGVTDWVAPGIGRQLAALMDFEQVAHRITAVNPLLIPGLLQTRDYARSIMLSGGLAPGQVEHEAIIRMGRQNILARPNPANYVTIIGEQAIRYPACGDDTMSLQLKHLLSMTGRPNVSIHVLPMEARYTIALEGPFVLLEFANDKPVVQVDSYCSTSTLTNAKAVLRYQQAAESVRRAALNEGQSAKLIADIAENLESKI